MPRAIIVLLSLAIACLAACRTEPNQPQQVDSLKISIAETGPYRLSSALLAGAGFSPSALASGEVRLAQGGEDVPFAVSDDALIFYGLAPVDRYAPERVYVLTAGAAGKAMALSATSADGAPQIHSVRQSLHLEENLEYVGEATMGSDADAPWFWQTIGFGQNPPLTFDLDAVGDGSGQLRARFHGMSHNPAADPDHMLAITVNAAPDQQIAWDGQQAYEALITLPTGTLRHGTNTISIETVPQEWLDISKLDWIELIYQSEPRAEHERLSFHSAAGLVQLTGFSERPLVLDITEPQSPQLLEGWAFEAGTATVALPREGIFVAAAADGFLQPVRVETLHASTLDSAENQADLLIVTTNELAPALTPLVESRQRAGLAVVLAPIEEITDTFGYGARSPLSLRQFISHAYHRWQKPAPRYLLLVGAATVDNRGYLQSHPNNPVAPPTNIIPTFTVPVSFGGETVSDARLADVAGDVRPELAVGRWPVDSVAEVGDLVRRTLEYEQSAVAEDMLFAIDGSGPEFDRLTERIIDDSLVPRTDANILRGPSSEDLAGAVGDGAWLISYVGHGSLQLWGQEAMLSAETAGAVFNGANPSIVMQFTCLTGLFAHPGVASLSQVLLTHPNGPPLVIGATSLTLSVHQEPFASRLLQAIHDEQVARIGDALLLAKDDLDVNLNGPREISDTFLLFGDPSALINRPTGVQSGN